MPHDAWAYRVHSCICLPQDDAWRLADADYEGFPVRAAVQPDIVSAFQCHPEKSGKVGRKIVGNFFAR